MGFGKHADGEFLDDGSVHAVFGEFHGDGAFSGLVRVGGDDAIAHGDVAVDGGDVRMGAFSGLGQRVAGSHDGGNHIAGRGVGEPVGVAFIGRIHGHREFSGGGLPAYGSGRDQRHALRRLSLGGLVHHAVRRDDGWVGGAPFHRSAGGGQGDVFGIDRGWHVQSVQYGSGELVRVDGRVGIADPCDLLFRQCAVVHAEIGHGAFEQRVGPGGSSDGVQ